MQGIPEWLQEWLGILFIGVVYYLIVVVLFNIVVG